MAAAVDMFVGMSGRAFIMMMIVAMWVIVFVRMFVAVLVLMRMAVIVLILMGVLMRVCVLMGMRVFVRMIAFLVPVFLVLVVGVFRALVNTELDPTHPLPLFAIEVHMEIAQIQFRQLPLESRRFHPKIDQRADGHVAADAGGTIQIKNAHDG